MLRQKQPRHHDRSRVGMTGLVGRLVELLPCVEDNGQPSDAEINDKEEGVLEFGGAEMQRCIDVVHGRTPVLEELWRSRRAGWAVRSAIAPVPGIAIAGLLDRCGWQPVLSAKRGYPGANEVQLPRHRRGLKPCVEGKIGAGGQ